MKISSGPGVAVFAIYFVLAGLCTSPLLQESASRIASDPGDPVLNASVLWWNATTVPFSEHWWNPPYFHLTHGVSAFTENLMGVSPIASPIYWLTGNPLSAYNLSLFLTWPLSAFAVYLLVRFLTRRTDAAFIAGLAYGFSPYRIAEVSHLQMVSSYWLPLSLLGLHGYLARRRAGWLVLFGAAWLLQCLANSYMMILGAVLIGMWVLFFCSTRATWRAVPAILAAWTMASLPLVPIMLKYRSIHDFYGLRRNLVEPTGFSYPVSIFGEVFDVVRFWHHVLPVGDIALFPGVTAALVAALGALWSIVQPLRPREEPPRHRSLRIALALTLVVSVSAFIYTLIVGPWSFEMAGVLIRTTTLNRAVLFITLSGVALIAMTPRLRKAAAGRSPLLFYVGATVAMALCSLGPLLRAGGSTLLTGPYRWLMYLPGFTEIRVPTRFWMMGVMCLAVAAGLSFTKLRPERGWTTAAACALAGVGLLLDGWLVAMPMADAPAIWPVVEARGQPTPIIELPLGPDWDAAATYRSIWHRRGVVNGVSGYDPAHYAPLQFGLNEHDPAILEAIATFGAFDAVVDGAADSDGELSRLVLSVPGVQRVAEDGARTAYRVPASDAHEVVLGAAWPIAEMKAFRHDPTVIVDGRIETEWGDNPQRPGQWVMADLGSVREVGGVTHALGEYARDYPRMLVIESSLDGTTWEEAWHGSTLPLAFRAAVIKPREAVMRFAFPVRRARFVRLRQIAEHKNMWRIAELQVNAPAGP